jgi:hypothetical protein
VHGQAAHRTNRAHTLPKHAACTSPPGFTSPTATGFGSILDTLNEAIADIERRIASGDRRLIIDIAEGTIRRFGSNEANE